MRHAAVLLCVFAVPSIAALSQATPTTKAATQPPAAKAPEVAATIHQLPVRQVVLYKNGIGYFEHLGSVTGNQRVAIDFTSSQLNDVLQSLTILDDNGGRIGGVNYNSTTPLAEQLKSLSLAMSDDPTSTELFQALRGQRVEVTGAPGGAVTGRLMSIEGRGFAPATSDEATEGVKQPLQRFWLTVVAGSGAVRVIELTPTLSVRPLDASLQGQLDRYLELLSSTHSTGLRHLTLDALGQGPRHLHVSYISEVPVWKSTYRIVFPKDSSDKAILQGWAVVDNTIGSDWDNVQLSLVAGAPQSFIQPLSQPLYLRRPEVPISTTAQTTPQTHEAADMPEAAPPQPQMAAVPMNGRNMARLAKLSPGVATESVTVSADVVSSGSGNGFGSGSGSGAAGGVIGGIYGATNAINEGDVATNKFDDFFQYTLAQPVTIHKNESAMVPILQENLPAERVTLWSQTETTPFRAIWLENTSKLTFDRGSFSIFESGVFAGQGLLDPIHPGEKRLLSYAADQAIHVREHPEESKRELLKIHFAPRGYIHLTYGAGSKNTFIASNSAEEARVVVLEVPRQPNRDLAPETKPAETTPSLYRFRLAVPAHQSASVLVADQGPQYEDWIIQPDGNQVAALQRLADAAPAIADKLKPIIAAQQAIEQMNSQLKDLQQQAATLTADEARARENLTALKGNDAGKRFVDELNRSEDQLEANRRQIADLNEKKKAAVESLRQTLAVLEADWGATGK
jgi:hypothetical protein